MKKVIDEFWENFFKILKKMSKEIHLFAKIFEKNGKKRYTFFPKIKKSLKKGLKKRWSLQKSQKSLKKMGNVKKMG